MNRLTVYSANSEILQILIQTMNGRMYDPAIGRVLSPDKFVQSPGYTQSYNRYSYCMNNPLKYTDPSGWSMMLSNGSIVGYDFNDWGNSNSANLCMPGSGGHWSDENRSVFGNYMLMDAAVFQSYYGISKDDYTSKVVPNYQGLPHSKHDFIRNHDGQIGFFSRQQFDLGSFKNDGLSDGADINGIGVGVRFVYIAGANSKGAHNTPGGTWDWMGVGSVPYNGEAWFGTNFVGPGPDKNPYSLGLKPIDAIDKAAQKHDYYYWKEGASGVIGAVFNNRVAYADRMLVSDSYNIMQGYKIGAIDSVTGLPISERTYNIAQGVYYLFTALYINKTTSYD